MTFRASLFIAFVTAALGSSLWGLEGGPSLTELWEKGTHSFSEGKFEEARSAYEEWGELAKSQGVESAEAHYNLGLSYWQLKQSGPAVFHILKSTRLRLSPFRIWTDLATLSDIQKKIGVKENLPSEWFFRFSLLVNPSVRLFLIFAAFWSLCGAILLVWVKPKTCIGPRRALFGITVGFTILVGVAYFNTRYYCHFAVLTGPNESISVFKTAEKSKDEILADFPAGTIVNILKETDTDKDLDAPIAGWVSNENVQAVN